MRILIIAIGRTGGHQFSTWLSKELNHTLIHEPNLSGQSTEGNEIVVKYLVCDTNDIDNIDFSNWDKIIGLVRTDVRECAISMCWVHTNNVQNWHIPYEITNKWISENEIKIKKLEDDINSKIKAVNTIKQIQLRVTYEGIYNTKEDIQKVKDYIGIKETRYEHLLNSEYRLRTLKPIHSTNEIKEMRHEPTHPKNNGNKPDTDFIIVLVISTLIISLLSLIIPISW